MCNIYIQLYIVQHNNIKIFFGEIHFNIPYNHPPPHISIKFVLLLFFAICNFVFFFLAVWQRLLLYYIKKGKSLGKRKRKTKKKTSRDWWFNLFTVNWLFRCIYTTRRGKRFNFCKQKKKRENYIPTYAMIIFFFCAPLRDDRKFW